MQKAQKENMKTTTRGNVLASFSRQEDVAANRVHED